MQICTVCIRGTVVSTVVLLAAVLYGVFVSTGQNHCSMSWSYPSYNALWTGLTIHDNSETKSNLHARQSQFPEHYVFHEYTQRSRGSPKAKDESLSMSVVFVPGQAGTYEQVRSVAARLIQLNSKQIRLRFFTFDFGEELSALSASVISRQCEFIVESLRRSEKEGRLQRRLVFIGHSMGGLSVMCATEVLSLTHQNQSMSDINETTNILDSINKSLNPISVESLLLLSSPISEPVFSIDKRSLESWNHLFYERRWFHDLRTDDRLVSISGGSRDHLVEPLLSGPLSIITDQWSSVMRAMEHDASVWCHDLVDSLAYRILNGPKAALSSMRVQQSSQWSSLFQKSSRLASIAKESGTEMRRVFDALTLRMESKLPSIDIPLKHESLANKLSSSVAMIFCDRPFRTLDICHAQSNQCSDAKSLLSQMVTARVSSQCEWSMMMEDRIRDAFVPRFIAMMDIDRLRRAYGASSSSEEGEPLTGLMFASIKTDGQCAAWQGWSREMAVKLSGPLSWNAVTQPEFVKLRKQVKDDSQVRRGPSQWHWFVLRELPSHIISEITVTVGLVNKNNDNNNESDDHQSNGAVCVSGVSGTQVSSLNGVYELEESLSLQHNRTVYKQSSGFWYSAEFKQAASRLTGLLLYRYQPQSSPSLSSLSWLAGEWVISREIDNSQLTAYCTDSFESNDEHLIPNCKAWAIYESERLKPGNFRRRNSLQMAFCEPRELSMMRVSVNHSPLKFHQWFLVPLSSSSSSSSSITHRISIPRSTRVLNEDSTMQLRFDLFINPFSSSKMMKQSDFEVKVRYDAMMTAVKTSVHDWPNRLPRLLVSCGIITLSLNSLFLFLIKSSRSYFKVFPNLIMVSSMIVLFGRLFTRIIHDVELNRLPWMLSLSLFLIDLFHCLIVVSVSSIIAWTIDMIGYLMISLMIYLFNHVFSSLKLSSILLPFLWAIMLITSMLIAAISSVFWLLAINEQPFSNIMNDFFIGLIDLSDYYLEESLLLFIPSVLLECRTLVIVVFIIAFAHCILCRGWFSYLWTRLNQRYPMGLEATYSEQRMLDQCLLLFCIGTRFDLFLNVCNSDRKHSEHWSELALLAELVAVDVLISLLNSNTIIHCGKFSAAMIVALLGFIGYHSDVVHLPVFLLLWMHFKLLVTLHQFVLKRTQMKNNDNKPKPKTE